MAVIPVFKLQSLSDLGVPMTVVRDDIVYELVATCKDGQYCIDFEYSLLFEDIINDLLTRRKPSPGKTIHYHYPTTKIAELYYNHTRPKILNILKEHHMTQDRSNDE
jgi:hypothetical protein